ncbi:hypothetical protein PSTAB_1759 [Stutzerimonas stutzeri]|uniref:Uncharacterized protein n=1 Tax=Stutzerimonas stutzeri (strain ATCC 17588 / DSM 5190 / CCUG 11256 / JCM 5965 / LMG 11199 / NBRC 14165 / NCIMB 11358 / Stanier 221) TaxID=96563 RepID=F8H860_STUS2|nr:hypothetical protein PSTAB_1759 [Stutzerimonas stutzeri]
MHCTESGALGINRFNSSVNRFEHFRHCKRAFDSTDLFQIHFGRTYLKCCRVHFAAKHYLDSVSRAAVGTNLESNFVISRLRSVISTFNVTVEKLFGSKRSCIRNTVKFFLQLVYFKIKRLFIFGTITTVPCL